MLFEKQDYQEKCVANIINVLESVDLLSNEFNGLRNAVSDLYKNNNYSFDISNKNTLDVLMETGTGKTFTYLKTIFEIHRKFGKNKFIIVLPRVAIKLGVIQNIKLTSEYFYNVYHKHLNFIDYPKDGINSIVHNFINNNDLSVLIMTNGSFNSNTNVINQRKEDLFGKENTWDAISGLNPVVIIDEPHLLKGGQTSDYLDKLDSLFIRFGATYPKNDQDKSHNLSNVVYALDSVSSFNHYLVKKIRVNTYLNGLHNGDLQIKNISCKDKKHKYFEGYYTKEQQIYKYKLFLHDDIGAKLGISSYNGVIVTKIQAKKIFLSNGSELSLDNGQYTLSEDEIRVMIRITIQKHFEKEEFLFKKNIKALSLFFIPSINGFRGDNPIVKNIFEEEYQIIRKQFYDASHDVAYKKYLDNDYDDGKLQVHEGYFSGDKGTKEDKEAKGIDIILNKKEELLSFDTPLRFIFSVWALQEGWDNPNIFNICKLSSTDKETSRRQQIGRGLRIAVNQDGKRLTYKYVDESEHEFYNINTLDMVVSGHEKDFIENIQKEILDASFSIAGDEIDTDILANAGLNKREANRLLNILEDNNIIFFNELLDKYEIKSNIYEFINGNREQLDFLNDERYHEILVLFGVNKSIVEDGNKPQKMVKIDSTKLQKFKQLWEIINQKSKIVYKNINEAEIIDYINNKLDNEQIATISDKVITKEYDAKTNTISKTEISIKKHEFLIKRDYHEFLLKFSRDEKLPLPFVVKMFNQIDKNKLQTNPKKTVQLVLDYFKEAVHNSLLQKIEYQFCDWKNEINFTALHDADGKYLNEIKSTLLGRFISDKTPPVNLLYDTMVYDSKIELDIMQNDPLSVNHQQITVFAKLPKISIPTPYKTYNPDFAYLIEKTDGKQLFLVVESKGYDRSSDIDAKEHKKIDYAKRFFEQLQKELPDVEIRFEVRINKSELSDLLQVTH